MMVKSGLEKNILKFNGGLQRYKLTCPANSAFLGRFFYTGQQLLRRSLWNLKIFFSRPLFTIMVTNLRKISLCIVWHQKPTVNMIQEKQIPRYSAQKTSTWMSSCRLPKGSRTWKSQTFSQTLQTSYHFPLRCHTLNQRVMHQLIRNDLGGWFLKQDHIKITRIFSHHILSFKNFKLFTRSVL